MSKRFEAMCEVEIMTASKFALLKISVITGWKLPEGDMLKILIGQFIKFMMESYPTINGDELEYAFRNKDARIKDWGKDVNLSMLDEVLIPYMSKRATLSEMEREKISFKPPLLLDVPPMLNEEKIKVSFDVWKYTQKFIYISEDVYHILELENKIALTDNEKRELMQIATIKLNILSETDSNLYKFTPKKTMVKMYAKKLAVEAHFKLLLNELR